MERSISMPNSRYNKRSYNEYSKNDSPRTYYDRENNNRGNRGYREREHSSSIRRSVPRTIKMNDPFVLTHYRILCGDEKCGGVIGKGGETIKMIRRNTGARIGVHELVGNDKERIIEISDKRWRNPNGKLPEYSPAQEALLMVHERLVKVDQRENMIQWELNGGSSGGGENGGGGWRGIITTRLVIAKPNVGSLLGKGGKIIEKMRDVTKTKITVLTGERLLPSCVSVPNEVVEIVGEGHGVKQAVEIIASLVRESQFRDRSQFNGRSHSPEDDFRQDDDFSPRCPRKMSRHSSMDGLGPRFNFGLVDNHENFPLRSGCLSRQSSRDGLDSRNDDYDSKSNGYAIDTEISYKGEHAQKHDENSFRILCPENMVDKVIGETEGIMELLQGRLGVKVRITEVEPGSEERVITVYSDEGPNDDLFPSQEALLHIQSQIVDLSSDNENIITTRLLVPSSEIECLEGCDGSISELATLTGANIQILSQEELPMIRLGDRLVQIVGEIGPARVAVAEITERIRRYRKEYTKQPVSDLEHRQGMCNGLAGLPDEDSSHGGQHDIPVFIFQDLHTATIAQPLQDSGASEENSAIRKESDIHDDVFSRLNCKLFAPLVTKSTLEVIIPKYAISKLLMRSGSKLSQISEFSGASVSLIGDALDVIDKAIQISGTPEQTQRAQSLLQGFIMSTEEDASAC